MSMSEPQLQIKLLSDPQLLGPVRGIVKASAEKAGFDADSASHLCLAVDEGLANIIRHGYESDHEQPIWMSIWFEADDQPGLTIHIEDEAQQVDPSTIRSRDLEEVRPGGLGVHLIQEIMDECSWEKRGDKGMILKLRKRLPGNLTGCGSSGPDDGDGIER
ncbi:MAG: anti-sigma regulatory factor [Phycisphaerae bacterium]|nr:anti-sigma regulatory factor [Phycisphaerae bacterium]